MIRNYITIAFRNFRTQKSYTFLNVIGLSLGMAASLLIMQYVKYEKSFDSFHSRAKDIYRIQYNGWQNGILSFESAVAVPAAPAALKNNFAEVEAYTRFLPLRSLISFEKPGMEPVTFREERAFYADTSLFKVFDFELIQGDAHTCLKGLDKIILSESTARKYFGNEDPIGKRLTFNGQAVREVTGVFRDVPENSHIKFDLLVSYETLNAQTRNQSETSWGWYDFYSFVLLKPGTDVETLQAKWDEFLVKERGESWKKNNEKQEFILRPLTDIHLYSNLLYETSPQELRDGDSVYALSIIALFILIIAWVNYVNLATARSFKRANEVGVRKVVGAFKGQLVSQFLTESFILNIIAVGLALIFVRICWTPFSQLTGWNIPLTFILQKEFWLLVLGLFVMGAFLSGFYPAILLSSFKPVAVLKGKVIRSSGGNFLRKGLVVFQFVASVMLISGTLVVYQQLNFMKNKDLGFNMDQTLVLKGPQVVVDSLLMQNVEAFKTEVLRIPGVKGISVSQNIPGEENYWTNGIRRLSGGAEGSIVVTHMGMDWEHVTLFGIKVLAGRNYDRQFKSDGKKILINEALCKDLGFREPQQAVGEMVIDGRDTLEIAGVLANYHQMSLKAKVIPVAFRLHPVGGFYSLKLETENYHKVISDLEGSWNTFFPGNPIDYFFLDQFFNRQYDRDDRFGKVFTLFTILAIFIASLGLLGLASFMTVQRTKEIGIRKVLGSSANSIVLLLSKGFIQLVLIANLIAWPLAWWVMHLWLQSFPYRTSINPLLFLVAGAAVVAIAFLSVSFQTLKAAGLNPAKTLKYE
jgi:putative ABC transport system permease protein